MNGLMIVFIVSSYLLGSVPYGDLVARSWGGGKDIQKGGSGSKGAVNVWRVTGKFKLGIITLVLDMLMKGTIIVAIAYYVFRTDLMIVLMLSAVILGHIFPIFAKFKGGKGIAALIGGIIGLSTLNLIPLGVFLIPAILWVSVLVISILSLRFGALFLSNLAFVFTLLPLTLLHIPSLEFGIFTVCLFIIVILAHRENFRRLRRGEEKGIRITVKWGSFIAAINETIVALRKSGERQTVIKLNWDVIVRVFQIWKKKWPFKFKMER